MHIHAGRIRDSYPITYIAGIDGVRGLCALGIMLGHTRPALFTGAGLFMDIFFTVSGYLITSVLIRDFQNRGTISLRQFYLRRAARLYPALTVLILGFLLFCWMFSPNFLIRFKEAMMSWFYVMNYAYLFTDTPTRYLTHTWSLAVEEQFYLVWPILFLFLLKWMGLSKRLAILIFSLAILFWLWRVYLVAIGTSTDRLYGGFDARADSLLVGCGLAVLLQVINLADYPRLWRMAAQALFPFLAGFLAVSFFTNSQIPGYYVLSPLCGSLPAAITIVGLQFPDKNWIQRFYESSPAVFCGQLCYGLYIWHFPIFVWIESWASLRYITVLLVGWPLTFLAATLSYVFIEQPIRKKVAAALRQTDDQLDQTAKTSPVRVRDGGVPL